jgi:hypothetical protein
MLFSDRLAGRFPLAAALLAAALALAACRSRTLVLRPLAPENPGGSDVKTLSANLDAMTLNLNDVLNVLDSPEKYSRRDVDFARSVLAEQSALAADYIAKADAALRRRDAPRDRDKVFVHFPRIDLGVGPVGGAPNARERALATAREQVLACESSLLNLRMSVKDTSKEQATFSGYLADARKELASLEAPNPAAAR